MQEIVNTTRGVSDLQRVFPINAQHAMVVRGPEANIAVLEWLLAELDKPVGSVVSAPLEFRTSDTYNPVARIIPVPPAVPVENLQELVNAVRSTTHVQRIMPARAISAIVLRGTEAQAAQAEQLIQAAGK